MDEWFGGSVPEDELASRYRDALHLLQSDQFTGVSRTNERMMSVEGARDALRHFNEDWINLEHPEKGGRWWPQVSTKLILEAFRTGMINASLKGLGWTFPQSEAAREDLFRPELEAGMRQEDLEPVLPRVTCWACPSEPGKGTFLVDALRSKTVVQVLILTPGKRGDQSEATAGDGERVKQLERENARLKRIVVDKELELDELRERDREGD